uniref:Src like adaptor 2 n=1 Tax=Amazona collaria TaxID=241587 RepID=A0A8B9FQ52_9PSIT
MPHPGQGPAVPTSPHSTEGGSLAAAHQAQPSPAPCPGAQGWCLQPMSIRVQPGPLFPSQPAAAEGRGLSRGMGSGPSRERDGDWWLVASEVSGKECHIPSRSVPGWLYEGVSRQKAEELLLRPGNRSGSFLIRESQTRRGCFSLSVRRCERGCWPVVTHYRIHRLDNGWLYIAPRLTFPSLHSLVEHYSEGLCCALGEPCAIEGVRVAPVPAMPAVVRKPSLNWDKIDSSLLLLDTASPPEDSPISLGLREAVSSYLLLTGAAMPEEGAEGKGAGNC